MLGNETPPEPDVDFRIRFPAGADCVGLCASLPTVESAKRTDPADKTFRLSEFTLALLTLKKARDDCTCANETNLPWQAADCQWQCHAAAYRRLRTAPSLSVPTQTLCVLVCHQIHVFRVFLRYP
jgi:hypothetical protein